MRGLRSFGVRVLILLCVAGCVVIRPPTLQERPRWRIASGEVLAQDGACVTARAFVRKSGKAGFGLALQLRSLGDCTFAIRSARLAFASGRTVPVAAPGPLALPGRSQLYAWLPVRFDNDEAWNDGRDDATLELDTTGGLWRIGVHQQ